MNDKKEMKVGGFLMNSVRYSRGGRGGVRSKISGKKCPTP